ncbi:hypothetical protein D3C81_1983980 [compost metagenome]
MVLVLGVVYLLLTRFALKGDNQHKHRDGWRRRTFRDLIKEYRLTGRARRLAIRPGSPLIGQRLDDLKLR